MEVILIVSIPIAFLNIILFFKVWGMTNNTKRIRAFLETQRPDLYWHNVAGTYLERKED